MSQDRIPLNTFAIPFGLAGLANVWTLLGTELKLPPEIGTAFLSIAAAAWLWLLLAHLIRGIRTHASLLAQLKNPVQAPIAALVPIVGMLLGTGLYRFQPTAGRLIVITFIVMAGLYAAWILATWVQGSMPLSAVHGGYYLPTVAGGLIAATASAETGMEQLAIGAFAIGSFMWIALTAVILARLMFGPALPDQLVPTLAIFVAPPAVAGSAWLLIGDSGGPIEIALAALTALLLAVQVALVPRYRRLPFTLGFWSFTFPFAAVSGYGIQWLSILRPPGWELGTVVIAAGLTILIGTVAVKSIALVNIPPALAAPSPSPKAPSNSPVEVEVI